MLGLLQDSLVGSHPSRITHRSTESKHPTITQTHSVHFRPPFAPFGRRLAGLTQPRRILFSFRKSKNILLFPPSSNHSHPSQSEESFLLLHLPTKHSRPFRVSVVPSFLPSLSGPYLTSTGSSANSTVSPYGVSWPYPTIPQETPVIFFNQKNLKGGSAS